MPPAPPPGRVSVAARPSRRFRRRSRSVPGAAQCTHCEKTPSGVSNLRRGRLAVLRVCSVHFLVQLRFIFARSASCGKDMKGSLQELGSFYVRVYSLPGSLLRCTHVACDLSNAFEPLKCRSGGRTVGLSVGQSVGWLDGRLEGRTDGRTVRRSVGQTVGRSVGRPDGRTVSRKVGQKVGWSDGRSVRRSDRLSDGRTDGRTVGLSMGRSDGRSDRRMVGRPVGLPTLPLCK